MKHFIFFLFLLILQSQASAQSKILEGRIVDKDTQVGVAYTNIGIEGTFYGTASNAEGFFELKIPDGYNSGQLNVSAIGYVPQSLGISDLMRNDFVRIPLQQQSYAIGEVDIAAQSRVLFRVIRTASMKVPDNYHAGPVGLQFYYKEESTVNGESFHNREAIVELFDKTGYSNPSVTDAFKNRGYRFIQVKKNFESWSFPDGQTGFDELIEMDLARLSNMLFEENLLSDYDLRLEGKDIFEGDSVWVISYKSAKTELSHSGDYYGTSLAGKIYILQRNYALLRNECFIEADRNNSTNRSLAATNNPQQNVRYHFVSSYGKHNGRYMLSYIHCDKTYSTRQGEKVTYTRTASVLGMTNSAQPITGRNFFEDTPYVEAFWQTFKQ